MMKYGLEYDHSFSHHDALPHWLRVGDTWTNIDYSKHPDTWMKPLIKGEITGLVEIPASWYLDDLPPMVSPFSSTLSICLQVPPDVHQENAEQPWVGPP